MVFIFFITITQQVIIFRRILIKIIKSQQPYLILKHKTIIIKNVVLKLVENNRRFRNRSKYRQQYNKGGSSNQWGKDGSFYKCYCNIWVTIKEK